MKRHMISRRVIALTNAVGTTVDRIEADSREEEREVQRVIAGYNAGAPASMRMSLGQPSMIRVAQYR